MSIIGRDIGVSEMKQCISGAHGRAGDMDKLEIKILEEHHPASLSPGQFLWSVRRVMG